MFGKYFQNIMTFFKSRNTDDVSEVLDPTIQRIKKKPAAFETENILK
jgi:hypothetical protein